MRADALPFSGSRAATFVIVVARCALQVELAVVNRVLPDGFAPLLLRLLSGLDGRRTARQGFGDDVSDVLALQFIVGRDVR